MHASRICAWAFTALLTGSPLFTTTAGSQSIAVREITAPALTGSSVPNLFMGQDGRVYLSWVQSNPDTSHTFFFSWLDSTGWSVPRHIASGNNWFVNWADFPAFAVSRYGVMLATWLEKSGDDTYAYGIRSSTSTDYGQTWSNPLWLHDDNTQTEHGFVSLRPATEDGFHAIWLDGREMVRDQPMTLRYARVRQDGSRRNDQVIDTRVCDCCQTSAARLNDGSLIVAYRDRSPEEVRDISVARFDGASWSEPMTVHADNWKIAGCPVNGPAMDAQGQQVVVAWFTMGANDSGIVNCAWSNDGGRSFAKPKQLSTAHALGRVDVEMIAPGRAYVIWMEDTGKESRIMLGNAGRNDTLAAPMSLGRTSNQRDSGFPHLAYDGEHLIATWTDPSAGPRIRTAMLTIER